MLIPAVTDHFPLRSFPQVIEEAALTQAAYQEVSVGTEYVMSYYGMCNGNVLDVVNSTGQ